MDMPPAPPMVVSQAVPMTYGQAVTVPPGVAGEALLAGTGHRPIGAVEPERIAGPVPPGTARLFLLERAVRTPGGCVRRRWAVDFRASDPMRLGDAVPDVRRGMEEVALTVRGSCDAAAFVGHPGLDQGRAVALLAALARWQARPGGVAVRCISDSALAAVCATPARIRAALARAVPWHVPADRILWATVDGRSGYTITFDGLPPRTVALEARVPSPF